MVDVCLNAAWMIFGESVARCTKYLTRFCGKSTEVKDESTMESVLDEFSTSIMYQQYRMPGAVVVCDPVTVMLNFVVYNGSLHIGNHRLEASTFGNQGFFNAVKREIPQWPNLQFWVSSQIWELPHHKCDSAKSSTKLPRPLRRFQAPLFGTKLCIFRHIKFRKFVDPNLFHYVYYMFYEYHLKRV